VAKSPTEQIRELTVQVAILAERDVVRQQEISELKARGEQERDARQRIEVELSALKQQLQDHVKHTELSDARRWAFVLAFLSALLALASGLIVALVRK
jgi:type IV secretory pathway component VirB8